MPTSLASQIARNPEMIANNTYAGRNGNGPVSSGDGWWYRGRGLLQVTGRGNYRSVAIGLGLPLEGQPQLLEQAEFASLSAAWWWADRNLNDLADHGRFKDIGSIINSGVLDVAPTGAKDREMIWRKALEVLC